MRTGVAPQQLRLELDGSTTIQLLALNQSMMMTGTEAGESAPGGEMTSGQTAGQVAGQMTGGSQVSGAQGVGGEMNGGVAQTAGVDQSGVMSGVMSIEGGELLGMMGAGEEMMDLTPASATTGTNCAQSQRVPSDALLLILLSLSLCLRLRASLLLRG
jgi:hypothetical protein